MEHFAPKLSVKAFINTSTSTKVKLSVQSVIPPFSTNCPSSHIQYASAIGDSQNLISNGTILLPSTEINISAKKFNNMVACDLKYTDSLITLYLLSHLE